MKISKLLCVLVYAACCKAVFRAVAFVWSPFGGYFGCFPLLTIKDSASVKLNN